jgi:hypothetical protein
MAATATPPRTRPPAITSRATVVATTVAGVLAFNLLLYVVGRAAGGTFRYSQSGKTPHVDAFSVALMSVGPLATGLALVAWLSRRWPAVITTAKVVFPLLAVATIGAMTIPAGFDTTSALVLASMHLALVPASLFALGLLHRPQAAMGQDLGR